MSKKIAQYTSISKRTIIYNSEDRHINNRLRLGLSKMEKLSLKLSLEYHDTLNQKLWKGEELKPEVRSKLLTIAKKWQEYAKIPDEGVHDIVITGGNVNYNYTDKSDVDIHFLIDPYHLPIKDIEILQDYMRAKKDLWAKSHDITIYGYPVELYAQDVNQEIPVSQGVYSILNDDWVIKPSNLHLNFDNDFGLKTKVEDFMAKIDSVVGDKESIEVAKEVKNKITSMRGESIKKAGEFSIDNLVFKELRNRGYLDKISDYIKNKEDRELSLSLPS